MKQGIDVEIWSSRILI